MPGQLGTREGRLILGVRDVLGLPPEVAELAAASFRDGASQVGIAVVGEVLERRRRRPLLPLEEHGNEGAQEDQPRRNLVHVDVNEVTEALAHCPVAHLVVVLVVSQEALLPEVAGAPAVTAAP